MSAFPRSPGGIAGRQQLDETRERSMSAIYATVFAVVFAHTICLPSISSYLAGFHSESIMLGYCISAVCLGELCATPFFSKWYETAPARDLAMASLAISTIGSVLYAVSPNDISVLASRFIVGVAAGVQGPFFCMAAGLCKEHERYDTIVAVKSMHTAAFVLGTGVAAVATFVHTPAPVSPLNHMQHMMPKYVREMHLPNNTYSDSLGTLGDMVIPPDSYSKMGSSIWHAAAAKASAIRDYAEPSPQTSTSSQTSHTPGAHQHGGKAHARALLGDSLADYAISPLLHLARSNDDPGRLEALAPGALAAVGAALGNGGSAPKGAAHDGGPGRSAWQLTKKGFRGDSWHKLLPSTSDLRKMVPSSDEVSVNMHGALHRLNEEAQQVGQNAYHVGDVTEHDLGMAGIHAGSSSGQGQEGLKTDEDMAQEIGDKRMYMPQYVTAIVGHGTKAPGYLAALVSVGTAIFVWREWSHITSYGGSWDDIRSPIMTIPASQLNPRLNKNLAQLRPLVACLASESVVQVWQSSVETIIAPITGIYLGFTIDATAVFMMGIGASGVVALAMVPPLKKMQPMRNLIILTYAVGLLGVLLCIPWNGQLSAGQYVTGSYFAAMGFYPLSAMASQVFARGVAKSSTDGRDLASMLFFWRLSSVPVKIVAPVLLAYSLEFEMSASVCYLALLFAGLAGLCVFIHHRRSLLHQNPGDSEPQVLPNTGGLIVGEGSGLAGGSAGTKAYGSF